MKYLKTKFLKPKYRPLDSL